MSHMTGWYCRPGEVRLSHSPEDNVKGNIRGLCSLTVPIWAHLWDLTTGHLYSPSPWLLPCFLTCPPFPHRLSWESQNPTLLYKSKPLLLLSLLVLKRHEASTMLCKKTKSPMMVTFHSLHKKPADIGGNWHLFSLNQAKLLDEASLPWSETSGPIFKSRNDTDFTKIGFQ